MSELCEVQIPQMLGYKLSTTAEGAVKDYSLCIASCYWN